MSATTDIGSKIKKYRKEKKYVGLSNILDSELCRRKPAEGSHR